MTMNVSQSTNYQLISGEITNLIERVASADYESCIDQLVQAIGGYFPALTKNWNPVFNNLEAWSRTDLAFIIKEYSAFSNAAIHMFLEARIRNHWPALTREILRNMDEEMGVLTGNIPHLELMRYGYRVELGIETDGVECSTTTSDFIKRMNRLFCVRDNGYLAGVLLAFETTAVEEFRVVEQMLRRYKKLVHGEILPESLTWQYISGHVIPENGDTADDPEMDHYRGMVEAVGSGVANGNLRPMVQGFLSVCLELNSWWERLAFEAWQKRIQEQLAQTRRDPPELYDQLFKTFFHNGNAQAASLSTEMRLGQNLPAF